MYVLAGIKKNLFDSSLSLSNNDVNMDVFLTMTEADLKEIGITSFGIRRKLKLLIEKLGMGRKQTDEAEQKNVCFLFHYSITIPTVCVAFRVICKYVN